jgi:tRNA (guanine9-N1)-methyltransferase
MGLSVEDEVRCPKSGYSIDILVQALENRGAGSWLMHKHQGSLREIFQHCSQDLIYLSPDGLETLEWLTPDKVYVIGGIVDRTVSKDLSLNQ